MNEHPPFTSHDTVPRMGLTARQRMIARMGIIGFNLELGPNAQTPEVDKPKPELADELPVLHEE